MEKSTQLEAQIRLAGLLMERLERLSVDSRWARRSSGMRGSLLKTLEQYEKGEIDGSMPEVLELLINRGFEILGKAAKEISVPDDWLKP